MEIEYGEAAADREAKERERLWQGVGKPLRQYREARGISGRMLAKAVGVSHGYLCKVERGEEKPSEELLRKLGAELGWIRAQVDEATLLVGDVPADIVEMLKRQPDLLSLIRRAYTQAECMEASRGARCVNARF